MVTPSYDWFDALNHAFTSLASGGFSTKDASIAAFDSIYIDIIITLFMFLSGINFAMHFRLFQGDLDTFFNNRETRFYTLITFIGIIIITFSLWYFDGRTFLRLPICSQVVAIITTTDMLQMIMNCGILLEISSSTIFGVLGSTSGGLNG